jgi:hypothetical protein
MKPIENEILSLGMAERAQNILWGYNDIPFSSRVSSQQKFWRHLAPVQRTPQSFRVEAVEAARKISQAAKGKVTILASGGLDSEVVIKSFLEAGVDFRIVTIDFSSVNADEIYYLDRFCRDHNLTYTTIHLDILGFWENSLEQVAIQSGSVSPQVCALLHVINSIDEYVVVGDGDVDIFRQDGKFYDTWGEKWAYAPWMLKHKHPGCPSFFSYTSELEASMYLDHLVDDFRHAGWALIGQSRFHYVKPFLYYHHFGTRLREKIDIFHPLHTQDMAWRNLLANKLSGADSYLSIDYDLIRDLKLGQKNLDLDKAVELESGTDDSCRFVRPLGVGRHLIVR